ncbi:SRPBCC family protein [Glycomyces terrestris]|uniref:Polyketide cyclase n=1 Tax=Glycomyces terrestris TaxID=2493553 RepID=A0A426V0X4_9ACTN|nr:SRPBCC family protein [Glycomyces terrestris]RRS00541.1 polyketide cyclase [Glycomyces terrestris]
MITVEREIRSTPAVLWSHLGDLDRWAELLPTVDSVERLSAPGPIGAGSRFLVRQPGLAAAEYEVTDWRPGSGFTWAATTAGVRTTASHELRPAAAGTLLVLGIAWSGPGAWLAKALFSRKTRRFVEQEAAAFARLAEGERPA